MKTFFSTSLAAILVSVPALAGALTLQIDDVRSSPDAVAQNAVVVAHVTACRSPEKTVVTAAAEGLIDGKRQTLTLNVIKLSQPGAFAVSRTWPLDGTWTVKMVATNPDYKDYATALVVPVRKGGANLASAKVFYHAPSPAELSAVLQQNTIE